eukprot:Seg1727.3 transcript_id=Seg1727.3/GoldUCD/mRNA.D3Y31 product="cGMP-dependent protein kinase egl-4" protein_id=Seg1727.3/GoldUCD/D3Y31
MQAGKMGNGASSKKFIIVEGEKLTFHDIKRTYPKLLEELDNKNVLLAEKNRLIDEKNAEISRLKKEIHQLQCVVDEKAAKSNIPATILENGQPSVLEEKFKKIENTNFSRLDSKSKFLAVAVNAVRNKRFAVSAESGDRKSAVTLQELKKHPKDSIAKKLIKNAILNNNFLKKLEISQVQEIVNCMYLKNFKAGEYVIKEGGSGSEMYVLADGLLEVSKEGEILGKPMKPGTLFGELAILYNCTRTASVKAVEECLTWVVDRHVFQAVMRRTGIIRREEYLRFLKSVALLKDLSEEQMYKIVDVVEEDFYPEDDYIVREGEKGNTFYIIKKGNVKVMQMISGQLEPQEIRQLGAGDYFGEKSLLSEDVRTASIIAMSPGVECMVIERETFMSVMGSLDVIQNKDYGDKERGALRVSPKASSVTDILVKEREVSPEFIDCSIADFKVVATLGIGGFGRVDLVQDKRKSDKQTYALKALVKQHIVETKQQEHVYNEKKILMELDSPFIIRLYRTFRDKKYVYILMEVCLGGELWTILRDKNYFEENTARFYTACVVEAFGYLHERKIIFRDLKPENLLVDKTGYVKLVDFGFAKRIGGSGKTWTFCGTPEYVAPEIILNKGHDASADYWSLGVLIFELMTGNPPFAGDDPMSTYNIILRGIEAIDFPPCVTRTAQHLIKRLCRYESNERLGAQKDGVQDIRKHKWFQGFHWQGLTDRTLKPPFLPKVKNPTDHSNFDSFPTSKDVPPDELSGWDKDF